MKVGPHSGFDLDKIIEIKKREEKIYGKFYWGYAGTFCHPEKVIDFVNKSLLDYGRAPMMYMSATASKYFSDIGRISEYSIDGKNYKHLPKGITLTGCKYAIIAKKIKKVDFSIDLNKYIIVNGSCQGKALGEYIRYHVNKACAMYKNDTAITTSRFVKISFVAELTNQYAIFLR